LVLDDKCSSNGVCDSRDHACRFDQDRSFDRVAFVPVFREQKHQEMLLLSVFLSRLGGNPRGNHHVRK
jgi:hypothetical protein